MSIVPQELLGRIMGANLAIRWGFMSLGSLFAGFLLHAIGPHSTLMILTAAMVILAVIATTHPAVRAAP